MGAQEWGVSGAFRNLADVLETFETSERGLTVTNATPVDGNLIEKEDVSLEVTVRIPFLDGGLGRGQAVDLTPDDVRLNDDGSLHVEAQITARHTDGVNTDGDGVESESLRDESEGRRENSKPETEAGISSEDLSESDENPKINATTETETTDEKRSEFSKSPEDPAEVNEDGAVSTEAESSHSSEDSTDNRPVYQDPERLRDVYETHDTFTEMTNALGVDVTPQTVRRYMIKYDIHEPSSNTCSSSINTLLEADPDSIPLGNGDQQGVENDQRGVENGDSDEVSEPNVSEHAERNSGGSVENSAEYTSETGDDTINGTGDDTIRDDSYEVDETAENGANERDSDNRGSDDRSSPDGIRSNSQSEETYHEMVEPKGVELPDHLTLDDIKETVQSAKTLYEAERELEMSRSETRELLQELNLLDLVQSRLSSREHQKRTLEEINNRIYTKASSEGA